MSSIIYKIISRNVFFDKSLPVKHLRIYLRNKTTRLKWYCSIIVNKTPVYGTITLILLHWRIIEADTPNLVLHWRNPPNQPCVFNAHRSVLGRVLTELILYNPSHIHDRNTWPVQSEPINRTSSKQSQDTLTWIAYKDKNNEQLWITLWELGGSRPKILTLAFAPQIVSFNRIRYL